MRVLFALTAPREASLVDCPLWTVPRGASTCGALKTRSCSGLDSWIGWPPTLCLLNIPVLNLLHIPFNRISLLPLSLLYLHLLCLTFLTSPFSILTSPEGFIRGCSHMISAKNGSWLENKPFVCYQTRHSGPLSTVRKHFVYICMLLYTPYSGTGAVN